MLGGGGGGADWEGWRGKPPGRGLRPRAASAGRGTAGAGNAARGQRAAPHPYQPEAGARRDEDAEGELPLGKAAGLTGRRRSLHVGRVRGRPAESQGGRARRRAFPMAGTTNASRARLAPQRLITDTAWQGSYRAGTETTPSTRDACGWQLGVVGREGEHRRRFSTARAGKRGTPWETGCPRYHCTGRPGIHNAAASLQGRPRRARRGVSRRRLHYPWDPREFAGGTAEPLDRVSLNDL